MKKVKALEVVTGLHIGGLGKFITSVLKFIDNDRFELVFLTLTPDPRGEIGNDIKQLGGRIYHTNSYSLNPASYRKKNRKQLSDIIDLEKPDVIHVHPYYVELIAMEANKRKIPLIVHSHSSSHPTTDNPIKRIIKNKLLFPIMSKSYVNKAAMRVACSHEAGAFLFGDKNFVIVENGIDPQKFRFNETLRKKWRHELKINDDAEVLVNVGRIAYPKNQSFLVDVFNEYLKLNEKARLVLIGDGADREQVEQKIQNMGLENVVSILGNRSNANELLNIADLFVMPSFFEGMPLALVEAQANGLPCLVSDAITDTANIIGVVEFFPLDRSAKEWAEKIKSMNSARNSDAQRRLKSAGYDVRDSVKKLETIYEEITNKKP